jgi:hypothetical protein
MARDTKVFWSEAERLALVLRAIELRDTKLYESPLHIFREAMSALPASRRRPIRTLAEVPWFEPLFNEVIHARQPPKTDEMPIVRYIKEGQDVQRKFYEQVLSELRTQTEFLRDLIRNIVLRGIISPDHVNADRKNNRR